VKVIDLFEASAVETRNYKLLVEHLKKNCRANLNALAKSPKLLLRGDTGRGSYRIEEGSWFAAPARTQPRRSQAGNGLLLTWVSSAPAWKDVPRRSMSTSCTPDYDHAAQFGNDIYIIIPYDTVKQYATSQVDFNYLELPNSEMGEEGLMSVLVIVAEAFGVMHELRDQFDDERLNEIAYHDGFEIDFKDIHSMKEIKQANAAIVELQAYAKKHGDKELTGGGGLIVDLLDLLDGKSLIQFLETSVSPKKLGIRSIFGTPVAALKTVSGTGEIWFEGPYVAISAGVTEPEDDWFKQLVKEVNA